MAMAFDGKDSLFYPGMRRWDGHARVTNSWNKLNNVRAVFPCLWWTNALLNLLGS
jgi:hypothetical protein